MNNYLTKINTSDENTKDLKDKTLTYRDYGVLYILYNNQVFYKDSYEVSYDSGSLISMIDIEWNKNWFKHDDNKLYDFISGNQITSNMSDYSSKIFDKYIELDKTCYLEQYNKQVFEAINNNSFTMEIIFNQAGKSGSNSTIFALGQDSPRNRILWSWGGGDNVTSIAYKQTGTSSTAVTTITRNTIFKIVITIDLSGTATYYAYNLQTNTLFQTKTLTKGTATLNPETNNIININKLPNYAITQYSSTMKLYSLRFYNKDLSEEEIENHNKLDIQRFCIDSNIEYLQSTGTQYINTKFIPKISPKIEIKVAFTDSTDADVFGFASNTVPSWIGDFKYVSSNLTSYYRYYDTPYTNYRGTFPASLDIPIILECDNSIIYNGIIFKSTEVKSFNSNTQSVLLFKARYYHKVKIYYAKLYDGNELVMNLIPVRIGTIGYMYDKVSGKLFGNSGTGDFILGPDIK